MLDKKDFENIRKELVSFEAKRENVIQSSRLIIKISKQIIYSLHRDDISSATKFVNDIKKEIKSLDKNKNYDTGISSVAFQEFVEALIFYEIVKNSKFPTRKQLDVDVESYLSGIADLTGELVRKAVHDSINNNFESVIKIKELVEHIYGEFLKFDLRNGELRKKSDSIRWNLNKLEDMAFNISVGSKL